MSFANPLDVEMPTHVNGLPLEDVYQGISEFAKMMQEDDGPRYLTAQLHPPPPPPNTYTPCHTEALA